jgi:putative nucleotidyltransferase with HDIG domain
MSAQTGQTSTPKRTAIRLTRNVVRLLVLLITSIITFAILVLPGILKQSNQNLAVGQLATQDLLAPRSITFESRVQTEHLRKEVAQNVQPVYLPSDPTIAKAQLESLSSALFYLSTVRNDNYASPQEKQADINALQKLQLDEENIEVLLHLSDRDWHAVETEANRLLELVLRDNIQNNDLNRVRSNLPALVDYSLSSAQTDLVIDLVSQLVVPTALLSEEQTENAREKARQAVEPITRQIVAGQVLVRRAEIITDEDFEALTVLGLVSPTDQTEKLIRSAVLVTIIALLLVLYYRQNEGQVFTQVKAVVLTAASFLIFLGLARLLVIDRTILPYLYPMAAFGLTIAIIFNIQLSLVLTVFLATLTVFGHFRELEMAVFYILPVIAGMFTIRKARRISSFLVAGLAIALTGASLIVVFRLGDATTDWFGFSSLLAASSLNGIASASLALLLQYVFAQVLDLTTAMQLMDVARPDHPLLQFLLQNAPGSYQHSLLVSNLAEQAAGAIGADRMLVRVGTIFHDVGKANNPLFFIENQLKDEIDSHDNLSPADAAQTIIKHVTDGVALAKKYRMPSRIIDFILEHHGTMLTRYQYNKAVNAADSPEDVDKSLYTYPGPKPRSRETALLMLADGTEARARANTPKTDDEIKAIIQNTIDSCKNDGQLDHTDLTFNDLRLIANSFFETLKRSYHPRIAYPEIKRHKKPVKDIQSPDDAPSADSLVLEGDK